MNKSGLISKIAAETNCKKDEAEKFLNTFIKVVGDELKNGEDVRLVGFGVFSVVHRKAAKGRNPRTREPIDIPASNTPRFKPGKLFKSLVN